MFDVVRLKAVQIRASFWRAIVKVVVDHVVHNVATQSSNKHRCADNLWEGVVKNYVETTHHQRSQAGGEDQPRTIEWRLWREEVSITHRDTTLWEQQVGANKTGNEY